MIIALIGNSGTGKSTLTETLVNNFNYISPNHITTRKKRKDDNGFYKYVSQEIFDIMRENNEFYVCSGEKNHSYGVEKKEINSLIRAKKNIVINISIKDLPNIDKNDDLFILQMKYRHYIFDFFNNKNIKKLGWKELIRRFLINTKDTIKYRYYIKDMVDYNIIFNDCNRRISND